MTDRVVHQIREHALELANVRRHLDRRVGNCDRELQAPLFGFEREAADDVVGQFDDRHRFQHQRLLARLEAGQLQQLIHQPVKLSAIAQGDLDMFTVRRVRVLQQPGFQIPLQ